MYTVKFFEFFFMFEESNREFHGSGWQHLKPMLNFSTEKVLSTKVEIYKVLVMKIITKTHVKGLSNVFLKEFHGFRSYIQVFNPFELIFVSGV